MQISLSGHTALVTGASGQLGRTIARTLAECGANVAVHYHKSEGKAEQIAGEIREANPDVKVVAVQANVSEAESVKAMQAAIVSGLGSSPDIIVANAVSQYDWKPILEQPLGDYLSQWETCVAQNVLLAQVFIPAMIEKNWGRYVAINTECAMQCTPSQSAYVSGKRGMDGVLRVLAREVGHAQITVNQVAPGWMISDNAREKGTETQEGYAKNVPLKRRGDDRDIANAVAFFASDLAAFISGVYLPVSGGTVMPAI